MSSLSNKNFQNPEQPAFSLIAFREACKNIQIRASTDTSLIILGLPFSPLEERIECILEARGFGRAGLLPIPESGVITLPSR